MIQQIKHETGHVQFRVLREMRTGQNSLHLSVSTATRYEVALLPNRSMTTQSLGAEIGLSAVSVGGA